MKKIDKIGQQTFSKKKVYGSGDVGLGLENSSNDLEGFSETITKVKKEAVPVQSGALRKHKMIKQLSGKFSKEDLKDEAMEIHKKKLEEKSAATKSRFYFEPAFFRPYSASG